MCPCQLMPWDRALGSQLCFAICDTLWLTLLPEGLWGQSLSRSKGLWLAQRAVLEQHCTFWQRGKPSSELLEPWQEHWSSAVPGCPQDTWAGSRLWGCCRAGWRHSPAAPADRGLVWPGWPGAAGEPWQAGILPRNDMAVE